MGPAVAPHEQNQPNIGVKLSLNECASAGQELPAYTVLTALSKLPNSLKTCWQQQQHSFHRNPHSSSHVYDTIFIRYILQPRKGGEKHCLIKKLSFLSQSNSTKVSFQSHLKMSLYLHFMGFSNVGFDE